MIKWPPNGSLLGYQTQSDTEWRAVALVVPRQYYAFNCLNTVDCLDYERSSITRLPSGGIGRIHRYFFLADRLAEAEIFRLPHYSSLVFVTDSFVQRVLQHGLTGFEFVVVWDSQLS